MRDVLIVLVVLGVAAVLFLAAVVATQEGEVLADAPPDRPDVDLPAGHVVAEDLRSVRFGMVFRGYRMSEVDEVLERLGSELAERDARIADLEQALVDVVEPVVQEAEARQAAPEPEGAPEPDAPERALPVVDEAPEPALPPSLAPPLARGARGGEAPAEAPTPAPVSDASDEEELTPLPEEWVAAASAVSEPPTAAQAPPSPLDPGWEPSTAERALDLAASYRLTMPGGGTPVAPPAQEPEAEAEPQEQPVPEEAPAEPEGARTAVPEEELDFPEVEPAEPGTAWAPETRKGTGDEDREQRPTREP